MRLNNFKYYKTFLVVGFVAVILAFNLMINPSRSEAAPRPISFISETITLPKDSPEIDLPYPFKDDRSDPTNQNTGGLFLKKPSNIESKFEYDPETGTYSYSEKMGDRYFRKPTYMGFDEYLNYDSKKSLQDYWKQKSSAEDVNQTKGFRPKLIVKGEAFDRIFGGNVIDIRPQGSANLTFGLNRSTRENPALAENQRSTTVFDFDQQIQCVGWHSCQAKCLIL